MKFRIIFRIIFDLTISLGNHLTTSRRKIVAKNLAALNESQPADHARGLVHVDHARGLVHAELVVEPGHDHAHGPNHVTTGDVTNEDGYGRVLGHALCHDHAVGLALDHVSGREETAVDHGPVVVEDPRRLDEENQKIAIKTKNERDQKIEIGNHLVQFRSRFHLQLILRKKMLYQVSSPNQFKLRRQENHRRSKRLILPLLCLMRYTRMISVCFLDQRDMEGQVIFALF